MSKSQRSFGSKVRIATAGLVLGLAASLVSTTAAHAAPKGDGFGCTINPQLCEEVDGGGGFGCTLAPQLCEDPPEPPKPPKCQIILCDGDGPVLDPGTTPEAEPTPEPEDPKTEDPKTEDPKNEDPKNEDPQNEDPQTDTPNNDQNAGNGNTGNGNVSGTGRTRTDSGNVQQAQDEETPVEESDEIQTVAQEESAEADGGLSQLVQLLIVFTLGGAAYGLFNHLRQRKHS